MPARVVGTEAVNCPSQLSTIAWLLGAWESRFNLPKTQRWVAIGRLGGWVVVAAMTMATVVRHAIPLARWRCLLVAHFQARGEAIRSG